MSRSSAYVGIVSSGPREDLDEDAGVLWVRSTVLDLSFSSADLNLDEEVVLAAGSALFFVSCDEPVLVLAARAATPATGTRVRLAFARLDAHDHDAMRRRLR